MLLAPGCTKTAQDTPNDICAFSRFITRIGPSKQIGTTGVDLERPENRETATSFTRFPGHFSPSFSTPRLALLRVFFLLPPLAPPVGASCACAELRSPSTSCVHTSCLTRIPDFFYPTKVGGCVAISPSRLSFTACLKVAIGCRPPTDQRQPRTVTRSR